MIQSKKSQLKKRQRGNSMKKRTFTGCETCRIRKIKCDGNRPFCLRCEKSKLTCSGYDIKLRYVELLTIKNDGTMGHILIESDKNITKPEYIRRRHIPYTKFSKFATYKYFEDIDIVLDIIDSVSFNKLPYFEGPFGCFNMKNQHIENKKSKLKLIHSSLQDYAILTYKTITAKTSRFADTDNDWFEIQDIIFPEINNNNTQFNRNRIIDKFKKPNYEIGNDIKEMTSLLLDTMDHDHKLVHHDNKCIQMVMDCSITQDLIRTFLKHSTTMMHIHYKNDLLEKSIVPLLYRTFGQSYLFNSFVSMGDNGDTSSPADYHDMNDSQFEDFCRLIRQTFVTSGLSIATLVQLRAVLFNDLGIFQDSSVYLDCFIGFREISLNDLALIIQIVIQEPNSIINKNIIKNNNNRKFVNEKLIERIISAGIIKELLLCFIFCLKQDEMSNVFYNFDLLFNTTNQLYNFIKTLNYNDHEVNELLLWLKYMYTFYRSTSKTIESWSGTPQINEYGNYDLSSFSSDPFNKSSRLINLSYSLGEENSQISSIEIGYGLPITLLELLEKTMNLSENDENNNNTIIELEENLINWKSDWNLSIKSILTKTHEILYHLIICFHNSIIIYYYRIIKNINPSKLQDYVLKVLNHLEQLRRLQYGSNVEYKISLPFWCCFISGSEAITEDYQSRFENLFKSWVDASDKWIGKQIMLEIWKRRNNNDVDVSWIDVIRKYKAFGIR